MFGVRECPQQLAEEHFTGMGRNHIACLEQDVRHAGCQWGLSQLDATQGAGFGEIDAKERGRRLLGGALGVPAKPVQTLCEGLAQRRIVLACEQQVQPQREHAVPVSDRLNAMGNQAAAHPWIDFDQVPVLAGEPGFDVVATPFQRQAAKHFTQPCQAGCDLRFIEAGWRCGAAVFQHRFGCLGDFVFFMNGHHVDLAIEQ